MSASARGGACERGQSTDLKVRLQGDAALLHKLSIVLEQRDHALPGKVEVLNLGELLPELLVQLVELAVAAARDRVRPGQDQ